VVGLGGLCAVINVKTREEGKKALGVMISEGRRGRNCRCGMIQLIKEL
jgi:hypothetical protein